MKVTNNDGSSVSSFEIGIITVKGDPSGICIKFCMYDGSLKLQHWPLSHQVKMMAALEKYLESGRHTNFMFRALNNNALVDSLPDRHPYHTILTEKPVLTSNEVADNTNKTTVSKCSFVDRGSTYVFRVAYGNKKKDELFLHEYTAFSLLGYIHELFKRYDNMSNLTYERDH